MPSDITSADLTIAINLLRRHSSLDVVSQYLKDKSLNYSAGSWAEMREKRLQPALDAGELQRSDIIQLVREAEEFGRQHIFLFTCSKATAYELVNEDVLAKNLKKMNVLSLLDKPRLVEISRGLELVDIRIEGSLGSRSLVIKAVDARSYRRLVDKSVSEDREVLTYELTTERGVNVISVSEAKTVEVRIQSHRNSLDYAAQVEEMFVKATGIVDRLKFTPVSLAKTRLYLIQNRSRLSKTLRFADNLLRDKEGNVMSLASGGAQQNLYEAGNSADKGVAAFLSVGRPTCDEVDCFWLTSANGTPSIDIHTYIAGANNEFTLTAQCSRTDYAHVLSQITKFGN